MTTATLPLATGLSAAESSASAAGAARKSLLRRCYDALIEARVRQAMREIAMHRHLMPDHILKSAGHEATLASDGRLPFTRSA